MFEASGLKKEYDDLFTSYVGTDHAELGRLAAEGMVKGLKAEGKTKAQIVAVTGVAQQLNVKWMPLQKIRGFRLPPERDGDIFA